MVFDVKRMLRISSAKNGRKITDAENSQSDEDMYSRSLNNSASSLPFTLSKYNPKSGDLRNGQLPPLGKTSKRGFRKESSSTFGGYFNSLSAGASSSNSNDVETKLEKMFDGLRDAAEDSEDALGVESTMGYLTSLGLNPESGEVFVALELVQAPNFGEITRKGFVEGWKNTGAGPTIAEQSVFISKLIRKFSSDPAFFKRVYRYTFVAGKEADQRSMSLDNAIEFWRVLFAAPGRPWNTASRNWVELWVSFLREKWTRSVNRDMWNQTLEFAVKSMEDETLDFWHENGAWPSVIDDFVSWCRTQGIGSKDAMDTDS